MDHRALAAALVLVVSAGAAPATAEPAMSGFVHTRVGRAEAPFHLEAIDRVESEFTQAISFILGGELRVAPALHVGFRLPAAPSLVSQPAGSYVDDKAFGNPEIFARRVLPARRFRGVALQPSARLALGLPLAGHGPAPALTRNRVVAISAAMEGWREQELYVPGVVPLTVGAAVDGERGRLVVALAAELPILVRVADASITEAATRRLSLAPNLSLRGGARATSWLTVSLAAHLAAQLPAPVEQPGGNVQLSVEPEVRFLIADRAAVWIDFLVAVGGPLGGTAGVGIGVSLWR